jgi:hypothetical protein
VRGSRFRERKPMSSTRTPSEANASVPAWPPPDGLNGRLLRLNDLLGELAQAPHIIQFSLFETSDELGSTLDHFERLASEARALVPHGEIARVRRTACRPTPRAALVATPLYGQSECELLLTMHDVMVGHCKAIGACGYADRGEPLPDITEITPADLIAAIDEIYPVFDYWPDEAARVYAEAVSEINLVISEMVPAGPPANLPQAGEPPAVAAPADGAADTTPVTSDAAKLRKSPREPRRTVEEIALIQYLHEHAPPQGFGGAALKAWWSGSAPKQGKAKGIKPKRGFVGEFLRLMGRAGIDVPTTTKGWHNLAQRLADYRTELGEANDRGDVSRQP